MEGGCYILDGAIECWFRGRVLGPEETIHIVQVGVFKLA